MTTQDPDVAEEFRDISLFDFLIGLGQEKWWVLGVTLFASVAMAMVSLVMTPVFTARTTIVPPQQGQSSGLSALASVGAAAGLGGLAGLSAKNSEDMYLAYLASDAVRIPLIEKLQLKQRYASSLGVDAKQTLNSLLKVSADKKSGLIVIEASDQDPEFAAKLANALVEEFQSLINRLAITEVQQRRLFLEQQIAKTQDELNSAEIDFRQAVQHSGLQVTAVLAESGVRASGELRTQIASREIQLQAFLRFATDQNPDIQRIRSELSALRAQLAKIEQGTGSRSIPPLQQASVKAYRHLKVQEAKLEILVRQFELAKIDEAREGSVVQQLDVATAPERRSSPQRMKLVISAAILGLLFGLLLAIIRQIYKRNKQSPQGQQVLSELKAAWSFKVGRHKL